MVSVEKTKRALIILIAFLSLLFDSFCHGFGQDLREYSSYMDGKSINYLDCKSILPIKGSTLGLKKS